MTAGTISAEPVGARVGRVLTLVAALLMLSVLALAQAPVVLASPASVQKREWWIGRLGLTQAWQITKGSGVTVAVIDEGVDASVGDLQGALVPGFSVGGSGNPDVAHDTIGHGTSMAIHIAGRGTGPGVLGVAPKSKVLPVYLAGTGVGTTEALTRLSSMSKPPQIVNMSYGEVGACPADLQAAVKVAVDKGMILVASAGNDGAGANESQYPSNCKGVVAVGAFDAYGKVWSNTQRQPYVSLGGPGVEIVTYDRARTIGTSDGTSDAASIVSGEFALLRAHFPKLTSRQLVARMFATASHSLYPGPGYGKANDTLGYGPALVRHALTDSVPATAPNPVYDDLAKLTPPTQSSSPTDQPGSTTPAPNPTGTVGVSFPGSNNAGSSSSDSSGSNTGVIAGVVAAVALVLIVIGFLVYRRRSHGSASGGGPPPGAGSWS
jgi:subtilisin family serine protease